MSKSISADLAKEPPKVRVVGPFLGVSKPGQMRIVIALPAVHLERLTCELLKDGKPVDRQEKAPEHEQYRQYVFDFVGLAPGELYHYRFLTGNDPLNLEGGLMYDACHFHAPAQWGNSDSFVLMSCHNPFIVDSKSIGEGWAMWDELLKLVEGDPTIKFIVLGGDQVYNDNVEEEFLTAFQWSPITGKQDQLRRRFIRQYQLFWEDVRYRKVMARIPSMAMWDDHDITDGWGSRPEQFKERCKDAWQQYFVAAREAFMAYQISRNPSGAPQRLDADLHGPFTVYHDFGPNRIYMFDLRSERKSKADPPQLMSRKHEDAFYDSLDGVPDHIKCVFVLTPVVAFRTNFENDKRITTWSRWLFRFAFWFDQRPRWKPAPLAGAIALTLALFASIFAVRVSMWFVLAALCSLPIGLVAWLTHFIIVRSEAPKLSDDLEDGLTSDANRETFIRMLRRMFEWQRRASPVSERQVILLSGDIHLAGISEAIEIRKGEADATIPQIVSSPVAYEPMPKAAEGFTTTTSEMVLVKGSEYCLFARNIFYTSKRNFAQIFPGSIKPGQTASPALFYFEGHKRPLAVHIRFLPDHSPSKAMNAV